MQNLRKNHDLLLQTYRKVKSGKVSKDALIAQAVDSGFIDRVEDIFLNAISNNPESVPEWDWKPHWGMIEALLRALKTPTLHSSGTTLQQLRLGVNNFDVCKECVDRLIFGAGQLSEVVTYVSEILSNGVISFPSPRDGKKLTSDKGFIHYLDGKPYIFYVFYDQFPTIVIVNPNMGNIIAIYIPHRNFIIGHEFKYEKPIARLKIEILKHKEQVKKYISSESASKTVLISSFMQHTGHTLLNELPGFALVLDEIDDVARLPVLVGPHEFFPINSVFPEFASKNVSKFDLTGSDLFLYCLENSMLPVRPMMRHYFISEKFRARLRNVSVGIKTNVQQDLIRKFQMWLDRMRGASFNVEGAVNQQKSAIIWIEVRNNHRIWTNQADAIKTIIAKLIDHYPSASVFIAGWSLPADPIQEDNVQIGLDMKIYKEVAEFAAGRLPVICGVGLSSEEKLRWAFRCSASVVSFGSGMTLPCLVANLPSIVHANSHYVQQSAMHPDIDQRFVFAENLKPYIVIPAEHIKDDPNEPRYQVRNYSLSGDVIFDALRNILDS